MSKSHGKHPIKKGAHDTRHHKGLWSKVMKFFGCTKCK